VRICQLMIGTGFGGAERSFVDTALALADRGHDVQAICHRDFVKRSLLEGHPAIRVSPVVVRGAWDVFAARRIQTAMAGFGPDVVHVHLARGAHLGGIAAKRLRIPVVAKMHNYAKLKYYRHVDGFIGTTEDQGRYLRNNGIAERRIAVIPNFSRMPVIESLRPTVSMTERPIWFVTIGRLHEVKGYDILLQAMKRLVERGLPVRLTIGGDGPDRTKLAELRDALGLQQHVELAGWVDDPIPLLDRGDVYVLSSRTESFGISLLEAMSRGLPIVSTRCQGPSQLLGDDLAWFAPPEDPDALAGQMAAACENVSARASRGGRLREMFVEQYSESRVVPRILNFYTDMGAVDTSEHAPRGRGFVRIVNDGSLFVRRDAIDALQAHGWTSAAAVMTAGNLEVLRKTNGRDNCQVVLADGTRAYLKRHWTRPWPLLARRAPGVAEARTAAMMKHAGVPTMNILAAGERSASSGLTGPSVLESFSLSEAFSERSGFELVTQWLRDGQSDEEPIREERRRMIAAAARTVRRMHAAGLFHQDLFWQHLFFRERDGQLVAHLIDLQRAVRAPSLLRAICWWKDMEQLRYSMQRMRFTQLDIEAWYASYFLGRASGRMSFGQRLLTMLIRLRGAKRAIRLAWRRKIGARRERRASTESAWPETKRRAA
jgi:glycosyltransferase involved in cell wall biosynthesis